MTMRTVHAGSGVVGRINPCRLIELPEYVDPRGRLSVVEADKDVAFDIKRVYYLYDLPNATVRGAHGHRELEQLVIALHGEFDVMVDDGYRQARFHLDRPSTGLYIGPMVWRDLLGFSSGAVGLVLASMHYDEADYYRDYEEFLRAARSVA
ncbi:FdtA/QdtA family cupin domain-containing protein [Haloechinothrix sp. LS1_15]|uniref:sugar 3,4-ketoisomerase n=1 Tax=Haloechinothrix sp. LS1_15 TaxID=2652248 RepID=UPI0029446C2E|nr:FdtA/QdtA family cupin domain-containing protein [Haloechinothrix sp. LS1_15]MDV6011626.1 WxcM-like domain-containing protein [Haloechinothrix sp. LS1_15]